MPTAGGKPAAEQGAGAGEKGGQARGQAGRQQGQGRAPGSQLLRTLWRVRSMEGNRAQNGG